MEDCRVNRIKAVQQALDGRTKSVYLEIGVKRGATLRRITADEKIAVDPAFRLSERSRRLADANARATHYFEVTSDAFFESQAAFLELRDVENALRYLRDDGVIVLHDCNPALASIGYPAASFAEFYAQHHWWNVLWSGDVWKAIVYLRSTRDDLRIAVLKCDFGVGIIGKGMPESRLSYSAAQIEALDYADLAADREHLLNLKPPAYLGEFLASERRISPK
jgi:hypothetical protein